MNDEPCCTGEYTIEPIADCPSCCDVFDLAPDAVMTVRINDFLVGYMPASGGEMFSLASVKW